MILVLTDHVCKPDRVDVARQKIEAGGAAMSAAPGFLFRYRLEKDDEPSLITTVAAWDGPQSFAAYRAARPAADPNDPAGPFLSIQGRSFEVRSTHGNAPATG